MFLKILLAPLLHFNLYYTVHLNVLLAREKGEQIDDTARNTTTTTGGAAL